MGSEQGGFFQIVSSSQNMEIPKSFVSQAGGSLGKRWFLRDVQSHSWSVEVAREGTHYLLHRGWSDFYTHNFLEQGDILVFERRTHDLFDFKIFGENACEKGKRRPRPVVQVEDLEEDNEEIVDVDGYPEEDSDDEEGDDEEEDDDDDIDYIEEEEEEEEEEEDIMRPKTTPATKFGAEQSKRKYQHTARDYYGSEIFKSGFATRPENPYFVSRSRTPARKNELYIPKDVIEDYHLQFPEKLILVDVQGRKWMTKVKQWKDGRLWCIQGWKRLCRVNNIGPNDTCICEFVRQQAPQEDVMWIRVQRVASV